MVRVGLLLFLAGCFTWGFVASGDEARLSPLEKRHLSNLRQLTFGGENAEGYFDPSGHRLIFQSTRPPFSCDQIFLLPLSGGSPRLVSTGKGKTTCSYFLPPGDRILFSSTHLTNSHCPPRPNYRGGYVWPLDDYDIFTARTDGSTLTRLTHTSGYDAEATASSDGKRIVFTSIRDGDLEIYSMKVDGTDVKRLTNEKGYDGGPFFSADGQRIVYRAHHPKSPGERRRYQDLIDQNLVEPSRLEIFLMNADGSDKKQVTRFGTATFCPFFHPDGKRIIFASNLNDPKSRNFDLYLIRDDGTGVERITDNPEFEGFPMFSPDGKRLVFASNRNGSKPGETNLFVADWKD